LVNETIAFEDDYLYNYTHKGTFKIQGPEINPAVVDLKFFRSPINVVFPMYLTIALVIMVSAQTLAFMPFYLNMKKVDGYSVPLAAGILSNNLNYCFLSQPLVSNQHYSYHLSGHTEVVLSTELALRQY